MPQNNLGNYSIAKGRTGGRFKNSPKPPKFFSFGGSGGSGKDFIKLQSSGWDDLDRLMKQFGIFPKRSKLIALIKKSIKPTLVATQNEVARIDRASPNDTTGNLFDSIGFITGRSKEFVNVQVGPRAKGRWKGFHGHFVEFGTRSRGQGGRYGAARPNPFMKPGFDKSFRQSVSGFEIEIAKYVEDEAQKLFG
jgi:hypothetical protein